MNLARYLIVYTDLCASVRVCPVDIAVEVLGPNAPKVSCAGGTCSLIEGVLGVFTSNEPRGSRVDKVLSVGALRGENTLNPSIPLSLGRAAML